MLGMNTRTLLADTWFPLRLFSTLLVLAAALPAVAQNAANYAFTHVAGSTAGPGYSDGVGANARFFSPGEAALDNLGNLYIADGNNTVRKITPAGVVTTLAGKPGISGSADGSGADARFGVLGGIAVDSAGRILVSDATNHTIRRISPQGNVETIAGTSGQAGQANGVGPAARFSQLHAMAIDPSDNLYVIDANDAYQAGWQTIRKITPAGVVTTVNLRDANGTALTPMQLTAIATDLAGQLYFVDTRFGTTSTIYRATPDGVASALTGQFPPEWVASMKVGASGNFHITYPVNLHGVVTLSPSGDLLKKTVGFKGANGVAVDAAGNIYVTDFVEDTVYKLAPDGSKSLLAGSIPVAGADDGTGVAARFNWPEGLALAASGDLYVADRTNSTIRRITTAGNVTTFAGLAANPGNVDAEGATARFNYPSHMVFDTSGNLYVLDQGNCSIRKITPAGVVTTLAGTPNQGGGEVDGLGTAARFSYLGGVAIDRAGNLFVAGVDTLRKVTPAGEVTTIGGAYNTPGSSDGPLATARFFQSGGMVMDRSDNLFIADSGNHTIRKVTPAGNVTTVAGTAGMSGSVDGKGAAARFYYPADISVDADGNLYVADSGNRTIRKITPDGTVSTLGGVAGFAGSENGVGPDARFYAPNGIVADPTGNIYVADSSDHAIRKGVPAALPIITTQPASQTVAVGGSVQLAVTASGIPAPAYQWYFNGTPLSGATASTLSFTNVRASDAGDYTVVVSNAFGTATSNKAVLTVTAGTTPPSNPPSGGGGAPSLWFLLALSVLGLARRRIAGR